MVACGWLFFFFFSSRRRHTRCSRDWSSDVCSSDLSPLPERGGASERASPEATPSPPPDPAHAADRAHRARGGAAARPGSDRRGNRSEEHTSELQSRLHLVCRLLLEKKKKKERVKEQYEIVIDA